MASDVSAVKAARLGKGPVTDATPHGVPLIDTDCVVVGSAVRTDRFSVMLLLPPPNEQPTPDFEHSTNTDGGSVPLKFIELEFTPFKINCESAVKLPMLWGMVPLSLLSENRLRSKSQCLSESDNTGGMHAQIGERSYVSKA